MTDGRVDGDFELWQRRRDAEDAKRAEQAGTALARPPGSRRGHLTAEEAAARRKARQEFVGSLAESEGAAGSVNAAGTLELQKPAPVKPADPETSLRATRLGFVAAVVLVMFLLWIRQRRSL